MQIGETSHGCADDGSRHGPGPDSDERPRGAWSPRRRGDCCAVAAHPADPNPKLLRVLTVLNLPPQLRGSADPAGDLTAILNRLSPGYYERAQAVLHVMLGDVYAEGGKTGLAKAEYEAGTKLQQPAAETARGRLAALASGAVPAQEIVRYRGNAANCAICHER